MQRPLALTSGDPAGVGFDIAILAWQSRHSREVPPFYLLANPDAVAKRAETLGLPIEVLAVQQDQAVSTFDTALPVVPLRNQQDQTPGNPLPSNTAATIEAIDRAVGDVLSHLAAAVVTLPIAKRPLHEAGFAHPGHTEYLAHLAEQRTGQSAMPVMMLAGPSLRVVPVTIHMALANVPLALSVELVVKTCRITAEDLRHRFGVDRPRLAVAGLNPHAGEAGAFGVEDLQIIAPAVAALKSEGLDVEGPLPADTMFHAKARQRYDAAICMYHDQALIPAKALDFERSVNVTLGLPFVRTSPDHGTAFDIAGTGTADATSLIEALKLAAQLSARPSSATR